jgi:hypothetical protein
MVSSANDGVTAPKTSSDSPSGQLPAEADAKTPATPITNRTSLILEIPDTPSLYGDTISPITQLDSNNESERVIGIKLPSKPNTMAEIPESPALYEDVTTDNSPTEDTESTDEQGRIDIKRIAKPGGVDLDISDAFRVHEPLELASTQRDIEARPRELDAEQESITQQRLAAMELGVQFFQGQAISIPEVESLAEELKPPKVLQEMVALEHSSRVGEENSAKNRDIQTDNHDSEMDVNLESSNAAPGFAISSNQDWSHSTMRSETAQTPSEPNIDLAPDIAMLADQPPEPALRESKTRKRSLILESASIMTSTSTPEQLPVASPLTPERKRLVSPTSVIHQYPANIQPAYYSSATRKCRNQTCGTRKQKGSTPPSILFAPAPSDSQVHSFGSSATKTLSALYSCAHCTVPSSNHAGR